MPSASASSSTHPHLRIQYLSSEKFTNDLITAIRHDKTPEFRHRYRTIDLLLIDDIQFLSGKERTQEEFFHTYNDLYPHRQIVLSSDRSPKEIPDIEERLRSRFESALIADIQPPEFETRVAILKRKAELDRVALPDDVAYFIGNRVKSNIRELEGSLVRIRAFCNLTGRPLTLDLAQEVLSNIWGAEEHLVTIDDILRRVAEVFHVKVQDLRAKTRTKAVAFPRQVAMYLARQLTSDSYADIGRGFGGKDHTTVLHARQQDRLAPAAGSQVPAHPRPHHQHHPPRVSGVVPAGPHRSPALFTAIPALSPDRDPPHRRRGRGPCAFAPLSPAPTTTTTTAFSFQEDY